jgi:enoyl-CoA hydratase
VDGVATVALDDPDTRNALGADLLGELLEAFAAAYADPAVGAVVLASDHPRTFSAGGALGSDDDALVDKHFLVGRFPELFEAISNGPKPTVAAVGGHCLAGALAVVLACDLVVAGDGASFGVPELDVGVFPFVNAAMVPRNVGRKKARELLLLGERIDAAEAERIGLVNRVVPADELDAAAAAWAARLASRSPLLMRLGREAMARTEDMSLAGALALMQHNVTLASSTEDMREGIAAFREKREPRWRGR